MEVAEHHLGVDDPFPVQRHFETEDAMRGGVLWPDIDDVGRGADVTHGDSSLSSESTSTFSTTISPSTGVTGGGAGCRSSKRPNRVSVLPPPPVPSCPPPRSCASAWPGSGARSRGTAGARGPAGE